MVPQAPDFKTIAGFGKDNGKAFRGVSREFIVVGRRLALISQAIVAIDGSQFKAVNQRGRNFTPARMKRRLEPLDQRIARDLGVSRSGTRAARGPAGRDAYPEGG